MRKIAFILSCFMLLAAAAPLSFGEEAPAASSGTPGSAATGSDLDSNAAPFSAEVANQTGLWYLMGTLPDLSDEMTVIEAYYSWDGVNFEQIAETDWELSGSKQTRITCYPNESPLKEYLSNEKNEFYVKLKITGGSYEGFSETALIQRLMLPPGDGLPPLLDSSEYTVLAGYPATIYKKKFRPFTIYGQYYLTAASDSSAEQLRALLPGSIPVQVDIYNSESKKADASISYTVQWPELPVLSGTSFTLTASSVTPPESATVQLGDNLYRFIPPAVDFGISSNTSPLYATFNLVEKGSVSPLFLSKQGQDYEYGLFATLPLKPTGATAITVEISKDGGAQRVSAGSISLSEYPIDGIPNLESYTVQILAKDDPLLVKNESGNPDGFLVRLHITGSAFAQYTTVEAWPSDYIYTAPIQPGDSSGMEGNRGDAGFNDSDGTGVRPGTEELIPKETTPQAEASSNPNEQDEPDVLNPGVSTEAGIHDTALPAGDVADSAGKEHLRTYIIAGAGVLGVTTVSITGIVAVKSGLFGKIFSWLKHFPRKMG